MTFRWTDSQSKAINDRDGSLVVAASAGSGKTSAMVERALALIKDGVPVTKLMLLTFGEAAASEMKEKLLNGLIGYAKEDGADKDYICEQIDDLAFADISTIHGYCKRIVKDNFEAAEVSPSFEVADAETAGVLASKAIKNLLDKESKASKESFTALRDMLSARNDDNLIKIIRMLYEYAAAQPDRGLWLNELFDSEYGGDIEESAAAKYIVSNIKREAESLSTHIAAFQKRAAYLNEEIYINNARSLYERIAGYANSASLRDCYLERERERVSKWRNLTGSAKDSVLFEHAQSLREDVKAFEEYVFGLLGDYGYTEAAEILKGSAPQVAELIRLVNGFDEEYSKLKRENNVLDFSDLEKFALEVLRDEKIREEIVKEHDYVFVDEYQDTNYVQESIIRLITPDNVLFAVGDSKQCIYRFRLAEPKIFIDMLKQHRERERAVYFNDNFRSAPPILEFVNDVFGVLMTENFGGIDYKSEAVFNISGEYRKVSSHPAVEVCAITEDEDEADDGERALSGVYSVREAQRFVQSTKGIAEGRIIAEKIMSLVGKEYIADKEGARLIDYADITLMFKQRSNASGILSELVASGIPLRAGAFALSEQSVELSQLIDYLMFLDNPREDYVLLSAMRSRFGMFSNEELAEIRKRERRGQFYQAAESAAKCLDELGEKLRAFYERADNYRFLAEFTALSELAERIIEQSGYSDYLLTLASGLDKLDALKRFIAKLEGKSYARSLAAFADYYAEHSEEMDLGKGELSSENGVNVCTIHASKGLEYPVVILAGTGCLMTRPNRVGGVAADNALGVGSNYYDENTRSTSPSIVLNAIAAKKRFEDKEDALRLLYVAMTRAKSHLIITGEITPQKLAKKHAVRSASSYLEWLLLAAAENKNADKNIAVYATSAEATQREPARPMLFGAPDPALAQKIAEETAYEYPYLASVDLGIKYTATGINMDTERALPLFDSTSRTMGVDYHKVMQYIDYDALTLAAVVSELERMEEEGRISRETRDAIDPLEILRCLTSPIMRYAASAKCLREQRFMLSVFADEIKRDAPRERVLVQGTIDLLILGERTVIVDFKRSRLPEPALKERYRKQLEIYKRAAEEALNIRVDIAALYVFGSDAMVTVIEE